MNARDELQRIINHPDNYTGSITDGKGKFLRSYLAADAVLAEGYVKMPSREALAEALFQVYDHGTSPNAFREADAILALLAGVPS